MEALPVFPNLEEFGVVVSMQQAPSMHHTGSSSKQSLKLFVGGLAEDVTEIDLLAYFSKFGKVVDKQIKIDPKTQRSRGFGFVTFKQYESVVQVFSEEPHFLRGMRIDCKPAKSKEESQQELEQLRGTNRKIFVSNIPKNVSQPEIQYLFSQFGPIEEINLMYKKKETGFCYITFNDERDALKAIHHPNVQMRNNLLKVTIAIPKESVPSGVKIPLSQNEPNSNFKVDSRQMTRSSLNESSLSPKRSRYSDPRALQNQMSLQLREASEMDYETEAQQYFSQSNPNYEQSQSQPYYHGNDEYFDQQHNQYIEEQTQQIDQSPQGERYLNQPGDHMRMMNSQPDELQILPLPRNLRLLSSHAMGMSASKADEEGFGGHPLVAAARGRYSFDIDHTSQQHLLVPSVVPSSRYKLSTLRRLHDCTIPEQVEVHDTSVCPSDADPDNAKRSLLSSKPGSPGEPPTMLEQQAVSEFNFIENDFKFTMHMARKERKPPAEIIQEIQLLRHKIRVLEEEKLRLETELVFDEQEI
jgi:heterogeneous nuclear ribonucleoprotein A1/A3